MFPLGVTEAGILKVFAKFFISASQCFITSTLDTRLHYCAGQLTSYGGNITSTDTLSIPCKIACPRVMPPICTLEICGIRVLNHTKCTAGETSGECYYCLLEYDAV